MPTHCRQGEGEEPAGERADNGEIKAEMVEEAKEERVKGLD